MRNILEEVKQGIYHKTLNEDDILQAIRQAKVDIQSDLESSCEHNFQGVNGGYYYEKCVKCGKMK